MKLLLAHQQKPELAVEIYALASCYPYVANSRWFEDVAGRHIAATSISPTAGGRRSGAGAGSDAGFVDDGGGITGRAEFETLKPKQIQNGGQ